MEMIFRWYSLELDRTSIQLPKFTYKQSPSRWWLVEMNFIIKADMHISDALQMERDIDKLIEVGKWAWK